MNEPKSRWGWPVLIGVLSVILVVLVWPRPRHRFADHSGTASGQHNEAGSSAATARAGSTRRFVPAGSPAAPALTAEEIVAGKMHQFARSRREVMRAMAQDKNIEVPDVVERFFEALEGGDWAQIKAAFALINGGDSSAGHGAQRLPAVQALWAPIIDAYGVAEQVHLWPAQKLLEYGNAVLGSLRPGMVYVGGTDEGRWIPTLLNDTSDGERHIVITQNGLADGTYLEYIRFLYGDRFSPLSSDDSQRAFQDYIADTQRRLEHDEQFPDEPKQIRPDEQVKVVDGRIQVSGLVAVMDINERLLRTLMDKNPELSFALQESFPLKGTYSDAAPLGPIMELRASDQGVFTPEQAAQSVDYWRGMAEQLRTEPDESNHDTALKSFSKLAVGQANLFAGRGLAESAEETYRIALQMLANNTDAAIGLGDLLARTGRADEARALLEKFARDYPKQADALKKSGLSGSVTLSTSR